LKNTKIKSRKGFSFIELLAALIVITLIGIGTTAILTSLPGLYRRKLFVSESMSVSDTVNIALADILRYSEISSGDEPDILYFSNTAYQIGSSAAGGHFVTNKDNSEIDTIMINRGGGDDSDISTLSQLVSTGTYSHSVIRDFTIAFDESTHVFSGSYKIQSREDSALYKTINFSYKSIV